MIEHTFEIDRGDGEGGVGLLRDDRGRPRERINQGHDVRKRRLPLHLPVVLVERVLEDARRHRTTPGVIVRNVLARHFGLKELIIPLQEGE